MANNTVIFIVGPTAIGKTRLSIKLAKLIGGEIISADSMQVYKGMRILSQAPKLSEKTMARHHLVGVLDPGKEYSAASFRKKAAEIIKSVLTHKRIPIVAGGSGLYIKALIDGLFPSPEADPKFRSKMRRFAARYGSTALHERLLKIDPGSAGAIHPNDARRIIRALEIYHSTGRTMSDLKRDTKGLAEVYEIKIFGLTKPREDIYSNIDLRVDRMFKEGVLAKVKKLKKKRLSKTAKAVLGLKEISEYLDGKRDLDTAKYLIKRNTRRFAKRQLTWFRADKRIKWFDLSKVDEDEVVARIAKEAG